MERKFVHKVPGGKLLKVSVECEGGKVVSAKINGDFFAHPEDSIEKLEAELADRAIDDLDSAVNNFISNNKVKLYGVSASDIAYAIREAAK